MWSYLEAGGLLRTHRAPGPRGAVQTIRGRRIKTRTRNGATSVFVPLSRYIRSFRLVSFFPFPGKMTSKCFLSKKEEIWLADNW